MSGGPTAQERLLLRAAVGDGAAALDAWAAWRAAVDFDRIEGESLHLVPLLYRNLSRLGVDAQETRRYAGIYRHNWALNRLAFAAAARVVERLEAGGIPTLLLKGAALTLLYYRDAGVRRMGDVDVLVPPERLREAIAILDDLGFSPWLEEGTRGITPAWIAYFHSADFRGPRRCSLDLHWFASAEARTAGCDKGFWEAAVPVSFEGVATRALAPTDLLYHVLAHGTAHHPGHLRWAADAMTIMAQQPIDWPRFVRLAANRRLTRPLGSGLRWLASELGAPIPEEVLGALAEMRVGLLERLEERLRAQPRSYTLSRILLRLWCSHVRSSTARGAALALQFPAFLGRYYGVTDLKRLPALGLRRGIARIRHDGL